MKIIIKIKNLKKEKPINVYDIRVDRTSVLGNPFFMNNESERVEVCKKYEEYFHKQLKINEEFKKELDRIIQLYKKYKELNLFCWCFPKKCHVETIKNHIEKECSM